MAEEKSVAAATENTKPATPAVTLENFDWSAYENAEIYTAEERSELSKKYDATLTQIEEKEVINGKVLEITEIKETMQQRTLAAGKHVVYWESVKHGDDLDKYRARLRSKVPTG